MDQRPKCIIVTGRPGSGKTTLAEVLAEHLWMPVISRDAIKEGYVNTYGVNHDQLPADTNQVVSDLFFALVSQTLAGKVSVIIEAAFQHKLWASMIGSIQELSNPFIIACTIDGAMAAKRHLERGLADPRREFFHGDETISIYRETGLLPPPSDYIHPNFDLPTINVSTVDEYVLTNMRRQLKRL